jgi:hypothetical protein
MTWTLSTALLLMVALVAPLALAWLLLTLGSKNKRPLDRGLPQRMERDKSGAAATSGRGERCHS